MNGSSTDSIDQPTPFPAIDDDDGLPGSDCESTDRTPHDDPVKAKEQEKEKDVTPRKKSQAHRRSLSGNILKLLRSGSSERIEQDGRTPDNARGAMSSAMADAQRRKRKGSLRKAVLGKGRERDKDRKGKSPLASPGLPKGDLESPFLDMPGNKSPSTPRASLEEPVPKSPSPEPHPPPPPIAPPRWPFRTLSRVSIPSIRSTSNQSIEPASTTLSTSEDSADEISLLSLPSTSNRLRKVPTASSITTDSSSWTQPSLSVSAAPSIISDTFRRTSQHLPNLGYFAHSHARSPLASLPQSVAGTPPSDLEDEDSMEGDESHDYASTASWGYVILTVTWLVFVVGMGSCFGVWSWAWDVGHTPYAPPELEDDSSLPITGYYPALMVLTAVMAWVWVVSAWVGMKYFRHADFKGEEG